LLLALTKRAGSGSVSQRYGSEDPDPDPYQNTTDPEHWLVGCGTVNIMDLYAKVILFLMMKSVYTCYLLRVLMLLLPSQLKRNSADADDVCTVQELWIRGRAAPGSWCLWQRPGSWSPTTSYPFRSSIYCITVFSEIEITMLGNSIRRRKQTSFEREILDGEWDFFVVCRSFIEDLKLKHTPFLFLVFHCKLSAPCWVWIIFVLH
jgi:hypothetical protein